MKRLTSYSQHFLRSPALVKVLLGHSTIRKNDTVLDIGAGSGVITSVLAERCRRVIALEIEPRAAAVLRDNVQSHPNVTVVEADILSYALPTEPYKIFANIPFHLSSPIIKKLATSDHPPTAAYFIVQKQFARKLLASPAHFTSQLGASIAPRFAVRIRKPLNRHDFTPRPAVDTVLLELRLRAPQPLAPNEQMRYDTMISQCFTSPQAFATMPLASASLPSDIRPSQLSGDEWMRLFTLQKRY